MKVSYKKKKRNPRRCICVVDGQGGGIGSILVRYVRESCGEEIEIIALGTNAIATSQMLKAGANCGASGENAVCHMVEQSLCILGTISITWPNSMLGELTPRMAEAIMNSSAKKILLPLSQENVEIIGVLSEPLPHLIKMLVEKELKEVLHNV